MQGVLDIVLFSVVIFFFIRSIKARAFSSALVIGALYPTVAEAAGQESFKTAVTLGLLIIAVVFYMLYEKDRHGCPNSVFRFGNTPFIVSVAFLSSYTLLSAVLSPAMGTDYHFRKVFFFLLLTVVPFFMIAFTEGRAKDKQILANFIVCCSLVLAIKQVLLLLGFGISNYFSSLWLPRLSESANAIWLGRFLSIGVVFLFCGLLFKWSFMKLGMTVLLIISIVLTGSKAALYYTFAGMVCLLFLSPLYVGDERRRKTAFLRRIATFLALFSVAFVLLNSMNPLAFERRFSAKSGTVYSRQTSIRTVLDDWWLSETPVIGHGLATVGLSLSGSYVRSYPHNITSEVLYELGLLGGFLYYLPFMLLLPKLKKLLKCGCGDYLVLLMIFLLHAQTSGDLISNPIPFLILGLIVGQSFLRKEQFEANHKISSALQSSHDKERHYENEIYHR